MWIIPLAYYHREGINYVAIGVGRPLYMDRPTTQCHKLNYARVCVELDAIIEKLTLEIGEDFVVEVGVDIPWIPEKCTKCGVFGILAWFEFPFMILSL